MYFVTLFSQKLLTIAHICGIILKSEVTETFDTLVWRRGSAIDS